MWICQVSDSGTGSGYGACDVAYLLWSEMATNVVEACKMPRCQEFMATWYVMVCWIHDDKSRAESAVAVFVWCYDTVTSMIHQFSIHAICLTPFSWIICSRTGLVPQGPYARTFKATESRVVWFPWAQKTFPLDKPCFFHFQRTTANVDLNLQECFRCILLKTLFVLPRLLGTQQPPSDSRFN